jgi:hypothetical protein
MPVHLPVLTSSFPDILVHLLGRHQPFAFAPNEVGSWVGKTQKSGSSWSNSEGTGLAVCNSTLYVFFEHIRRRRFTDLGHQAGLFARASGETSGEGAGQKPGGHPQQSSSSTAPSAWPAQAPLHTHVPASMHFNPVAFGKGEKTGRRTLRLV